MTRDEALNILKNSNDKSEVRDAIEELSTYEEPEVVVAIVNVVDKFKLKSVTEAAKEALMGFKKLDKIVVQETIKLFYSEEPKVRAMAIDVIASFWNEGIDSLDLLTKNEDYNMRKYGVDILALVPTRKSLEELALLIKDENPNVKYSAIEALSYFEAYRDRVLEILEEELSNIDANNMYGIVSIIQAITKGAYKSQKLIDSAKEKLKDTNSFIKHYLYKLLLFMGDKSIISEARENAKSINLLSDWEKEEHFYTLKGE